MMADYIELMSTDYDTDDTLQKRRDKKITGVALKPHYLVPRRRERTTDAAAIVTCLEAADLFSMMKSFDVAEFKYSEGTPSFKQLKATVKLLNAMPLELEWAINREELMKQYDRAMAADSCKRPGKNVDAGAGDKVRPERQVSFARGGEVAGVRISS